MQELIKKFEANPSHRNVKLLCGGDGTLISEWRKNRKRSLLPIRNYGMCEHHDKFYREFLSGTSEASLKMHLYPTIQIEHTNEFFRDKDTESLSEIAIMNDDITQCMRFNLFVNNKLANENVLASGVIFATRLGSTGYFKSIARTIFKQGIGVAFINPTYSIPNVVLNEQDNIKLEIVRATSLTISCDKLTYHKDFAKGECLEVRSACNNIPILGYNHFMCEDCRRNRNSTIVNDSYLIS